MKVVVSVKGRFHAFDLARELNKRNALLALVTSYPGFKASQFGIDRNLIKSYLYYEVLDRSARWLQKKLNRSSYFNAQYYIAEKYDKCVAKSLNYRMDIFTGWSSFSLQSIQKVREHGGISILERGSSHIQYQNDILNEEYNKYGVKPLLPHKSIVEKELKEYQEADYISVPSRFVYNTFIERGISKDKLIINAYGVDTINFHPGIKSDNVFRVIYCGALSLRKGVQYLLQAFSELSLKNAELIMIGDMLPEIKKIMSKFKTTYIKHYPSVSQSQLRNFYVTGSVFVMPSIEEGMAMVQVQAMACGLPLICTTNTGGGDLIKDGKEGFIIPIRDVTSLKEKIEWLYCNRQEAEEMGQAAYKKVREGYTWNDYGKRMYKIYSNILKSVKS